MSRKEMHRQPIERINAPAEKGLSAKAVEERIKKGYIKTLRQIRMKKAPLK